LLTLVNLNAPIVYTREPLMNINESGTSLRSV